MFPLKNSAHKGLSLNGLTIWNTINCIGANIHEGLRLSINDWNAELLRDK